jgi:hypothetical protein
VNKRKRMGGMCSIHREENREFQPEIFERRDLLGYLCEVEGLISSSAKRTAVDSFVPG